MSDYTDLYATNMDQNGNSFCFPKQSETCSSLLNDTSQLDRKNHRTWVHVTLRHEMSQNVPDGHFHDLYFRKVNSMLFIMVKTIFKSED